MKRILYDVPKWHLIQHRDERALSLPSTIDSPGLQLEDEIFDRLFAGGAERMPDPTCNPLLRPWAERLHASCDALPHFARLADECRGDPGAAAVAVETIIKELGNLPEPDAPPSAAPPGSSQDPLRRPLLTALGVASRAVEALRDTTDGLAGVSFAPGSDTTPGTPADGARTKPLAARLRNDARLRRIALLAGRMKRIAASKRRNRVKHGVDEIADVEQGAEFFRALPAELVKLAHPRHRLAFLRALLERQVLQYQLGGVAALGRGPVVLLLDKSESMNEQNGLKDVWATALTLALLEHAHAERRPFAVVAYNYAPFSECIVHPGQPLPHEALFVQCSGGTSIAAALTRGLDIISSVAHLSKSDIVLVSDGESDISDAASFGARARSLGVNVFGLAIGHPAEALSPWSDEAHGVTDLQTLEPGIANGLFS